MRTFKLFSLLLVPLALAGCDIDHHDRMADVEFFWTFDGYGCRDADVRYVEIYLENDHGYYFSDLVPCRDGGYFFVDVEPGSYWVTAYGFASSYEEPHWMLDRRLRIYRGYNDLILDLAPTLR